MDALGEKENYSSLDLWPCASALCKPRFQPNAGLNQDLYIRNPALYIPTVGGKLDPSIPAWALKKEKCNIKPNPMEPPYFYKDWEESHAKATKLIAETKDADKYYWTIIPTVAAKAIRGKAKGTGAGAEVVEKVKMEMGRENQEMRLQLEQQKREAEETRKQLADLTKLMLAKQ